MTVDDTDGSPVFPLPDLGLIHLSRSASIMATIRGRRWSTPRTWCPRMSSALGLHEIEINLSIGPLKAATQAAGLASNVSLGLPVAVGEGALLGVLQEAGRGDDRLDNG